MFSLICVVLSACVCPKTTVCFTPGENCANQIIDAINRAEESVLVQAFEFTSRPIARSLIQAKERGVNVKVILDESQIQSKYSVINELFKQKIPIWIDYKPAIAHSKLMIIDNRKIITGSFNFTYSAQGRNAENLLIITGNHPLVEQYVENWQKRQLQSNPYQPIEE
ncbi:phospholipase D family protein [Wolbachia endosymbiont of Folsomia candida]|nr:phospholipase D family protein [Wolbachia endosymbiont of Folsomia candida]